MYQGTDMVGCCGLDSFAEILSRKILHFRINLVFYSRNCVEPCCTVGLFV